MKTDYNKIEKKIIKFIKQKVGNKTAIIGLSGGIDSSLVAYLCVKALGKKKVYGISTPSASNIKEDTDYARLVAKNLKIKHSVVDIESIIKSFETKGKFFKKKLPRANLTARIRMCCLYGKANEIDGVVIGTGNKSELKIGYFTKHGDGATDILPLGDLYKTEERGLAKYMRLPDEIINKPPSPGLWPGQKDEDELGITYELLDQILEAIDSKKSLAKFSKNKVKLVKNRVEKNEHKVDLPPICKL
ncbi:MAG: NAD+ synthase [Patescibacteria group bacterium]